MQTSLFVVSREKSRIEDFLKEVFELGVQNTGQGALEAGIVVDGHLVALVVVSVVLVVIVLVGASGKGTVQYLRIGVRAVESTVIAYLRTIRARPKHSAKLRVLSLFLTLCRRSDTSWRYLQGIL